jgi:hypothetical protein
VEVIAARRGSDKRPTKPQDKLNMTAAQIWALTPKVIFCARLKTFVAIPFLHNHRLMMPTWL